MPVIIGISGKIGSGKSTTADFLQKEFESVGQKVRQQPFALRLKETIATLCNTSLETQLTQGGKNQIDPVIGKTYGELQQIIGTLFRKELDYDIWIKLALTGHEFYDVLIIPDVRFQNEAEAIRSRNGYLIRLEGDPAGIRSQSNRDLNHISETDLDKWTDWDLKIFNEQEPLDRLYQPLRDFLKNLQK